MSDKPKEKMTRAEMISRLFNTAETMNRAGVIYKPSVDSLKRIACCLVDELEAERDDLKVKQSKQKEGQTPLKQDGSVRKFNPFSFLQKKRAR